MINRRDFLKALGMAAGAAFVPAIGHKVEADSPFIDLAPVEDAPVVYSAPAQDYGRFGRIQIDGIWYPLDDVSIRISIPRMGLTKPGDTWRKFASSIGSWEITGETPAYLPTDAVMARREVAIVFDPLSTQRYSGNAYITNVSLIEGIQTATHFSLRGVGPLLLGM
jgi:hypothetical protein